MKLLVFISFTCMFALFTACGNGGSDPVLPDDSEETLSGRFVDAVAGLEFETASQSGLTNERGVFEYLDGERVTFSIGDIKLPEIAAVELVSPLTIFSTDSIADISVINLARLLQSLDTDADATNGITIDQSAYASATGLLVDFASPDFDSQVANLVANSGSVTTSLISGEQALDHLMETLIAEGLATVPVTPVVVDAPASSCTSDSTKVGSVSEFETFFHGVSGTLTVMDDCTLRITNFNYDGQGPAVFFYLGVAANYNPGTGILIGSQLNGRAYDNETLTITLPESINIDDFDGISVWCNLFFIDFGSAPI